MSTFKIIYNNPDSKSHGLPFLVKEVDYLPHHYLQIDPPHTVGDGRLSKKYCTKVTQIALTPEEAMRIAEKKYAEFKNFEYVQALTKDQFIWFYTLGYGDGMRHTEQKGDKDHG